jgi:RNA polymerase sigma-70 factor (ECF subfamily)
MRPELRIARHEQRVRQVVESGLRSPALREEREEIVQTTFLHALRALERGADPERIEAWLATIARHAIADALRRRAARAAVEQPLAELDPAQPSAPDAAWIWDEVARLGASDREALALRYRDGLSYAEIARRLAVPESTVRGRLFEARRALKDRLARRER